MTLTNGEEQIISEADVGDIGDILALSEEAQVRVIKRTCLGPLMLKDEVWQKNLKLWEGIEDAGDMASAHDFIVMLVNDAKKVAHPGFKLSPPEDLPEDWVALRRIALPFIRLRGNKIGRACGYDVNDLVVAAGFDGEEHSAKCPNCGTMITWRAPIFYDE